MSDPTPTAATPPLLSDWLEWTEPILWGRKRFYCHVLGDPENLAVWVESRHRAGIDVWLSFVCSAFKDDEEEPPPLNYGVLDIREAKQLALDAWFAQKPEPDPHGGEITERNAAMTDPRPKSDRPPDPPLCPGCGGGFGPNNPCRCPHRALRRRHGTDPISALAAELRREAGGATPVGQQLGRAKTLRSIAARLEALVPDDRDAEIARLRNVLEWTQTQCPGKCAGVIDRALAVPPKPDPRDAEIERLRALVESAYRESYKRPDLRCREDEDWLDSDAHKALKMKF